MTKQTVPRLNLQRSYFTGRYLSDPIRAHVAIVVVSRGEVTLQDGSVALERKLCSRQLS